MRTLLLLALLALASLTLATHIPYQSCGLDDTLLTLDKLEASVWPPVKGQDLTLSASGTLASDISGGRYHVTLSMEDRSLATIDGDIGDFIALPWRSGDVDFTGSVIVPAVARAGWYRLHLEARDLMGKQITCIEVPFELTEPRKVY